MKNAEEAFTEFVALIKALRDPISGCPWDREQTHHSIKDYLIEEAYELLQAIEENDEEELKKELGDVLLQVMLHSQIAADRGAFTITDVLTSITEKMITRHPHVFGDVEVKNSAEVQKNWGQIKSAERKLTGTTILSSVPSAMPALVQAQRLGEKAASIGFDWKHPQGVWEKVEEEKKELLEAFSDAQGKGSKELIHEVGDLLFALCQLSRWHNISAEDALRLSCKRFKERFLEMENALSRPLNKLTEEEMEGAWQEAKAKLSKEGL